MKKLQKVLFEIDVKAGEIKAKIATQTYMVQCQKSKFVKNAAATCPLCGTEDEDLCHFILLHKFK